MYPLIRDPAQLRVVLRFLAIGTYAALLFPLFFLLAFHEQNRKWRGLYITNCVGLTFSAIGCQSESARWGVSLVAVLLFIVCARKSSGVPAKISAVSIYLLTLIIINGAYVYREHANEVPIMDHAVVESAVGVAENAISSNTEILEGEGVVIEDDLPISENLHSIETLDDHLRIVYREAAFNISYRVEDMQFFSDLTDDSGMYIESARIGDSNQFQIMDERFSGVQFMPVVYEDGSYGLQLIIDGKAWNFINELNGEAGYYYYNEFGKFDKITTAENWIFKDHGSFGNGRGFIWGETLPLLKKTLILDTGADSFTLVFPQDNYVEKYLNGYETMVISKPHNLYLQIGVQNGVLALALMLAALVICLYRLWKQRNANELPEMYGWKIGIAIGIIGYLFTGLVNDATICITPIFWCLVGIGVVLGEVPEKGRRK